METIIISVLLVLGFILLYVVLSKKLTEFSEKQKPSGELLEYLKTTNVRLDTQGKDLNQRLDNAAKVIGDVKRSVGEMSEIGRSMKDLQEFLRSPKLRGNIGEQVLKELLKQFLPQGSFNLQYTFKSGEKVDAAIKTSAGIIPVDSKFPMENFRKMSSGKDDGEVKIAEREFVRDVKKHIEAISKKYILTEEGTIDYALMYIPSEAVYYEIVNNSDLFEYASKNRILPVSPTTFYAYLRAILMSFEGQKIEEKAREILSSLKAIQKDYEKMEGNLSILQKHTTNAFNSLNNVYAAFTQLGQKIRSTRNLGENEVKKELLEKN